MKLFHSDTKSDENVVSICDIHKISKLAPKYRYVDELNRFAENVDPPTAIYPQINFNLLIQAILFCNTSR
jgi:hypothetical protein